MQYLGTPANLSSSTTGFLGQATAAGGFYTFGPSLTLLPNTQYFFYENAFIPHCYGGDTYAGGNVTSLGTRWYKFLPRPVVGTISELRARQWQPACPTTAAPSCFLESASWQSPSPAGVASWFAKSFKARLGLEDGRTIVPAAK